MSSIVTSRRAPFLVVACFLLLIAAFGGLGYWHRTAPVLAAENDALPDLPPAPTPVNKVPYPVVRVIDGDTIVVRIDGDNKTVRFIGVDTPETVDPRKEVQYYGREASLFTSNLLKGEHVYLDFEGEVGTYDKYQRLLAYVFRAPDGLFVNLEIVRQGYGSTYTVFPFKHLDLFRQYGKRARELEKGLYSPEKVPDAQGVQTPPAVDRPKSPVKEGDSGEDVTVYTTKTGAKYHRVGCRYLSKSKIPISLKGAKARGYMPCSVCNPPQ